MNIVETIYGVFVQKISRKLNPIQLTQEKAKLLCGEEKDMAFEVETKYIDGFQRNVLLEYATYLTSNVSFNVEISKNHKG